MCARVYVYDLDFSCIEYVEDETRVIFILSSVN